MSTEVSYTSAEVPYRLLTFNWTDGDCETMPQQFATEDGAKEHGEDWAEQSYEERPLANYWVENVEPPTYPVYKFGARWVCDDPEGRFHAPTKRAARPLPGRAPTLTGLGARRSWGWCTASR